MVATTTIMRTGREEVPDSSLVAPSRARASAAEMYAGRGIPLMEALLKA